MNLIYKLIHSPPIQCLCIYKSSQAAKKSLPDGESNPGLPRDRRGYLPLYYRGPVHNKTLGLLRNTQYTVTFAWLFLKFQIRNDSHVGSQKKAFLK